ncbi:hypothetical protein [Paenibacillus kyungheensis]
MAREYKAKLTMNREQMYKAARAQTEIYNRGFVEGNSGALATALGSVATILGLVFVTSTPAGIAAGTIGLLTVMSPSARSILDVQVSQGYQELMRRVYFFDDFPNYDLLEVEFVFFEDVIKGKTIRYVTSSYEGSRVTRAHIKNKGWVPVD